MFNRKVKQNLKSVFKMNIKQLILEHLDEEKLEELFKIHNISHKELSSRVLVLQKWLEEQPHLPKIFGN